MQRRTLLRLLLAAGMAPGLSGLRAQSPRFTEDPFALGVASGSPDHRSVVLWTRLIHTGLLDAQPIPDEPIELRWEVAEDEGFRRVVRHGKATALPQLGHAVHVVADGLQADRWYFFRFMLDKAVSSTGRTRTFPAPDAMAARLRFAYASCQRWEHGHYAAWRHMHAESLDCVLFVGDYIYEYPSPKRGAVRTHPLDYPVSLADYRLRYALYRSDPLLQAMHAHCPWLVTWDDHEVENNYAGARSRVESRAFPERRAAAYQAFYEHMPLRPAALLRGIAGLGRSDALRVYARADFGRLARFHVLDDRQYRDWQACRAPDSSGDAIDPVICTEWSDPRRSLLGDEQERWLHEGLKNSAQWNVLAQQTIFSLRDGRAGPAQSFGSDNWNGYPAARTRLLQSLQTQQARNPVIVGGDIHQNWVANVHAGEDGRSGPVVAAEFIGTSISSSSGQTQKRADELRAENPHCLLNNPVKRGYGVVEVTPARWTTQLRVLDDVTREDSGISTLASFVVEDGKAGTQPA